MVRRGSTVRVRQRACRKGPQVRAFCIQVCIQTRSIRRWSTSGQTCRTSNVSLRCCQRDRNRIAPAFQARSAQGKIRDSHIIGLESLARKPLCKIGRENDSRPLRTRSGVTQAPVATQLRPRFRSRARRRRHRPWCVSQAPEETAELLPTTISERAQPVQRSENQPRGVPRGQMPLASLRRVRSQRASGEQPGLTTDYMSRCSPPWQARLPRARSLVTGT